MKIELFIRVLNTESMLVLQASNLEFWILKNKKFFKK